jgi:hypothetical protein
VKVRVTCCGAEGANYERDFKGDGFQVGAQGELLIITSEDDLVAVVACSDWICAELVESQEQAN